MNYQKIGLKKIDTYIIKKFLGTFFYSIILILSIAVIFDLVEKIDDFYDNNAPFKAIVLDYYLSFIPYYANLFTPLFTFISVIFFTSKIANNTEIVAILSSGVSFIRLMRPYIISALVITLFSFLLGAIVIPPATAKLLDFEDKYIEKFKSDNARNVQMEVSKDVIMYIERYEISSNTGYRFSLEKFDKKTLVSRLTGESVTWKSKNNWTVNNYVQRDFNGMRETLTRGAVLDTVIQVQPKEFFITSKEAPQMSLMDLRNYLVTQKKRGIGNIQKFEDEYFRRFSMPISVLIMTLIGVSLSSRKVRGGMGLNLGIGLALSALYVLFISMSTSFAVSGTMPTVLAVWLPNIVFLTVGLFLYKTAPK